MFKVFIIITSAITKTKLFENLEFQVQSALIINISYVVVVIVIVISSTLSVFYN